MEALRLCVDKKTAIIGKVPLPIPAPNELLVAVHAIALNPVDALYTAHPLGNDGRVVGSDFAGVVVDVGSEVRTRSDIQPHDRVAGFLQGACSINDRPGAFAQYLTVPWDLVWRVPESMSLTDAATISLCGLTAAQAVYSRLGLPSPFGKDESTHPQSGSSITKVTSVDGTPSKFLIYGSSTSVALYAAQLVHRSCQASGIPVLLYGVASRGQHEMLTRTPYNYTALVDYHDQDWSAQLSNMVGGNVIDLAFDCISEGSSVALVGSLLTTDGKLAVVRSREGKAWTLDETTLLTEPLYGAVWEGLGEKVEYQGITLPASREAREFAVEFYRYLSEKPLTPNLIRLMPGGLESIVKDGFALLGSGTMDQRVLDRKEEWMKPVRGEKLVYDLHSKHR